MANAFPPGVRGKAQKRSPQLGEKQLKGGDREALFSTLSSLCMCLCVPENADGLPACMMEWGHCGVLRAASLV